MKTIALYNIKGGVGKTAGAVNLAYLSALNGYRTLLWDMDPQAAAGFYFRVKAKIKGGTKQLVKPKGDPEEHIKGTDYATLDLLPADFSSRNLDLMLKTYNKPTRVLTSKIPYISEIERMGLDCKPACTAPASRAAQSYWCAVAGDPANRLLTQCDTLLKKPLHCV